MSKTQAGEVISLSSGETLTRSESLVTRALRRLRRDKLTLVALTVIVILGIIAVTGPFINEHIFHIDPQTTSRSPRLPVNSPGHLLGTDNEGRDLLARLILGARMSLVIGFTSAMAILAIGVMVGLTTGYFGGIIDDFVNWVIVTLDSLPSLYLLIAVSALFEPSPSVLILVIAITSWTSSARLVRGQTFALRNLDYVLAARALGASPWRIMFNHIFPNLISILAISLAISIGNVILVEASLSFLSIGVQEPTPTWGNMLADGRQYIGRAEHLIFIPGVLISVTVLCLYVIGDGIRDAFDPQMND